MRNERGFTLVELIVTLGIASVLIALSATILLSSMGTVGRSTALTEKSQFTGEVYRFIKEIMIDSDVLVVNGGGGAHSLTLEADDKGNRHLNLDGTPMYDETHYYSGDLDIVINVIDDGNAASTDSHLVKLTVKLKEADGSGYSRSGTFRMLNVALPEGSSGMTSLSFTQPTL